jgi:hypothetical protein
VPISSTEAHEWLKLKRQELLLKRQLQQLAHIPDQLLVCRDFDSAAAAIGLELTRTDATLHFYAHDPELRQLQERHRALGAQVAERQRLFRQQCVEGVREIDRDFAPQRRITVQLRMPVLLH